MGIKQRKMKRVIKFRAWNKPFRKMTYGLNLYSINRKGVMNKAQLSGENIMRNIGLDCEVMQFTGLHDKTGKEVYEGDFFRETIESDSGDQVDYHIVTYLAEWAMFATLSSGEYSNYKECGITALDKVDYWTFTIEDSPEREVIGNIYEHSFKLVGFI